MVRAAAPHLRASGRGAVVNRMVTGTQVVVDGGIGLNA